jgi:hypothetical protein
MPVTGGDESVELHVAAGELSRGLPAFRFEHETREATMISEVAAAAAPELDDDRARREQRALLARVETPNGRPVTASDVMRMGRRYVARVHIGQPKQGWLGVGEPIDAPPPRRDGRPHVLHLLFWEPTVCPNPQVQKLQLWPLGDTVSAAFHFQTAEKEGPFAARIAVYHRNRNLQTGVLRARVGEGPCGLEFTIDAAPLPLFMGFEERAGVGASIVFNDDSAGRLDAFTFADGHAEVTIDLNAPGGVDKFTQTVAHYLGKITSNPKHYQGLASEGCRTLLRDLARHGHALLEMLQRHSALGRKLEQAEYVQVVRADPQAYFPVEFFYEGEAPEDDALVCDGQEQTARAALASGKCCKAYEASPLHRICPLRFWSLCKVLERQAHLPEHSNLPRQIRLVGRATAGAREKLDPVAAAILAASSLVDKAVTGTLAHLQTELARLIRTQPVPLADDWAAWVAAIDAARPALLLLLPHHVTGNGFEILEIGHEQKRASTNIRTEHVRPADQKKLRPLVLLLGCETNAARIDFESFVLAFQDEGAAAVVSTIASVLGRHVGPVAELIVQELKDAGERPGATLGEVLLRVRRKALADGVPMVLGLTSYGDADWRIGSVAGGRGSDVPD